jgi:hypothetical protein
MHDMPTRTPWYREPMVWLVIALPLTAVIGGFVTLALAIKSDDGLVVDDYYRRGKEINLVLERDRAAQAHGLRGRANFDAERRVIRITLAARDAQVLPAQIELDLWHATRRGVDRQLRLVRQVDGVYVAPLSPQLAQGHWYVQLSADDWRLLGSVFVPGAAEIDVWPAVSSS